jgi:hypothetical protein
MVGEKFKYVIVHTNCGPCRLFRAIGQPGCCFAASAVAIRGR